VYVISMHFFTSMRCYSTISSNGCGQSTGRV